MGAGIATIRAQGNLVHVVASMNTDFGVAIAKGNVAAVDTVAEKNGTGFSVSEAGLFLAHSTAIGNKTGVNILNLGSAVSFGERSL